MIGSADVERGVKFRAALAQGARRPSLPGSPGAAETGREAPGPKPDCTSSVGEVWSEPMVAWRGEEGGDENGYTDTWARLRVQALHSL